MFVCVLGHALSTSASSPTSQSSVTSSIHACCPLCLQRPAVLRLAHTRCTPARLGEGGLLAASRRNGVNPTLSSASAPKSSAEPRMVLKPDPRTCENNLATKMCSNTTLGSAAGCVQRFVYNSSCQEKRGCTIYETKVALASSALTQDAHDASQLQCATTTPRPVRRRMRLLIPTPSYGVTPKCDCNRRRLLATAPATTPAT